MDPAEILSYYVNGFFIIFLTTGALIVRFRDPKNPLNRSFYNAYLYFSLGFVNIILFRLLAPENWKGFFAKITIGLIIFSQIFLLQFNLILLDEKRFNRKKRWIFVLIWLIFCSGLILLHWYDGSGWLVNGEYPSGVPYWSTVYTIYSLVLSQGMFIVILIYSRIIKTKIYSDKIKYQHFSKNLAIFFYNWFVVGNIMNNWDYMRDNVPWFSLFMFYSTFLMVPGLILFFLSVIRPVKAKTVN